MDNVDQSSSSTVRLPRRDVWMTVIVLAVMAAADMAAIVVGVPARAWPAFIVMPGTLSLVWASYTLSVHAARRKAPNDPYAVGRMAGFMGRTLSLLGGVLTIAHIVLLGSFAGIGVGKDSFLRLFMVALGLVLIVTHNRMPKYVGARLGLNSKKAVAPSRIVAWTGVLSSVAMIVMAVTAPVGQMSVAFMALAFLPMVVGLGLRLIARR